MMFASHDVQFVTSLANRVLELGPQKWFDLGITYEQYLSDPARLERVGKAAGKSAA